MSNRAELTKEPDGTVTLTCEELASCWTFNDDWIAVQAQFALLKLFAAWDALKGTTAMHRGDFVDVARFVMASYEAPLTANLFEEMQQANERPKLVVHEGGK